MRWFTREKNRPLKAHDIRRRQKRAFERLTSEHQLLITLYKNDEIAKHLPELESVLWDFFTAGVFDTTKIAIMIFADYLRKVEKV